MHSLPREIICLIGEQLDIFNLHAFRRVSHYYYSALEPLAEKMYPTPALLVIQLYNDKKLRAYLFDGISRLNMIPAFRNIPWFLTKSGFQYHRYLPTSTYGFILITKRVWVGSDYTSDARFLDRNWIVPNPFKPFLNITILITHGEVTPYTIIDDHKRIHFLMMDPRYSFTYPDILRKDDKTYFSYPNSDYWDQGYLCSSCIRYKSLEESRNY